MDKKYFQSGNEEDFDFFRTMCEGVNVWKSIYDEMPPDTNQLCLFFDPCYGMYVFPASVVRQRVLDDIKLLGYSKYCMWTFIPDPGTSCSANFTGRGGKHAKTE